MKEELNALKTRLKDVLKEYDIIVDEVSYEKNTGNYNVLSVILDKVGGIDLDTVVEATNIINPIVDEYNITDEAYILDVASKERGNKDE